MNKKYVVLSVITLIIIAVLTFGGCKENKNPETTMKPTATPFQGSGLEDSIFGDDEELTEDNKNEGNKEPSKNENGDKVTGKPQATPVKDNKEETVKNENKITQAPKPSQTPSVGINDDIGFTNDDPAHKPEPTASPAPGHKYIDYETYRAMKPSEQQKYMESFNDMDAFFDWYNAEKDKYNKENPSIEVDGGVIDLEDIANGKK